MEEQDLFLKRQPTVRPMNVPFQIVYECHTFKYIESCYTKKLYVYVCKEEYNRHIKYENRCHAKIGVPFFNAETINYQSENIVLNKNHTCKHEEHRQMKLFIEIELRRLTE